MDLSSLRTKQLSLAASVERGDRLDQDPPTLIGGADVGFEQEGEVTRAAMVLLSYPSLELVEYQVARVATTMRLPLLSRNPRAAGGLGAAFAEAKSLIC